VQQALSNPKLYQEDSTKITAMQQRLVQIEQELQTAFQRWEDLDG